MNYFPIVSLDNFYEDPDAVREFALGQQFFKPDNGQFPGERTHAIHEIDPEFVNKFCKQFFSLYYNITSEELKWEMTTHFQKIPPYNDSRINTGWIHKDENTIIAGIVYLTPDADINSGTSIYKLKENNNASVDYRIKCNFYKGETTNIDLYAEQLTEYNNRFYEVSRFNNVYNTLVAYPGEIYHNATSFGSNQDRLIQVFGVNRLYAQQTPIERMRTHQ